MSFLTDLRGMSEAAVSQLTDRFGDLPRPLLAAIGAGDFAVDEAEVIYWGLCPACRTSSSTTTAIAKEGRL